MSSEKIRSVLLETARNDFPFFYQKASKRDVQLMDMLVLLTALFVRLKHPAIRRNPASGLHDEERAATRQMFSEIRAYIRNGRTFSDLPATERTRIQRVIFDRVE